MTYVEDKPEPDTPEPAGPRLKAVAEAVRDAKIALLRHEDMTDEIWEAVKNVMAEVEKRSEIHFELYLYERWWAHTYYHELTGRHLQDLTAKPAGPPPAEGKVIDFAQAQRSRVRQRSEPKGLEA